MSRALKLTIPMNYIISRLNEAGLGAYIYHDTGPSKYIKFSQPIGGSLRIADHPQRSRYAYRWNLRSDYKGKFVREKNGNNCMYYSFLHFEDMVQDMVKAKQILKNRSLKSHKVTSTLLPYHEPKTGLLSATDREAEENG